ncbi:MAG: putative hemolysin, partial [Candidatus Marinamargulisbacteria bacterium]
MLEKKVPGSEGLIKPLENPKKLITAILIGNNIANVGASAIATTIMLDFLDGKGVHNTALAMAIITGVMTFLLLTFGEITPKTLALKNPEKWAIRSSRPIFFFLILFHPIIFLFSYMSLFASKILRIPPSEAEKLVTPEDIKTIINIGEKEGIIEKEEREMMHNIFEFANRIVREIMVPRTDAICIEANQKISDAIRLITTHGHSRIPVYEDKIDNILGIIYAKDLLTSSTSEHPGEIRKFMRDPVFVPETKNIEELMHQMKKNKVHIAIVVDEYGGMSGVVTLEDIIEEIIGEIQDEYDPDDLPEFTEIDKDTYLVDAKMNIDDLEEKLKTEFPKEDDYDTLGGFVLSLL